MKAVHYLIVENKTAYNNNVTLKNGTELVVNTTIESVGNINRVGTVIASPEYTVLKEGDKVIVHHNIFRKRNGVKGKLVESDYHIEGDKYFVPLTEVFMYSRDNEDWIALDPYCFIEPIKKEPEKIGMIYVPISEEMAYKGRIKNTGIIRYINKEMSEMGLKEGDTIIFSNNSEYEFEINGKIYYKMSTRDILATINEGT